MSPSLCVSLLIASSLAFAAAPDKANLTGLPNFHEVNEHVYRGAQPTAEGFGNLAKLGVKTVIDLRGSEHSVADEQRIVEAAGMRYVSIPMRGMARPTDDQITKALALMNDESTGSVFVHCKRGADRTGATIACYRIQHDRWDSDKALSEARSFGMSWFQVALQHYVSGFAANGNSQAIPALISPSLAH